MSESTTEQLKEKAQVLEEILIDVQKDLAVSKDQAVAIESFAPGLLPREVSVNSFTEIPSAINLSATTQALAEGVRQSVEEAFNQLAAKAERLSNDFPPEHPANPVTAQWTIAKDAVKILETVAGLAGRFDQGNSSHAQFVKEYQEYTASLAAIAPELIKQYYTDTGLRRYIMSTSGAAEGYIANTRSKAEVFTQTFADETPAKSSILKQTWNVLPLIIQAIKDFCFPIVGTGYPKTQYPLDVEAEVSEAVLSYVERLAAKQSETHAQFTLTDYVTKHHILQEFGALYDRRYLVKEAAEATQACATAAGTMNPANMTAQYAFNMHAALDNNWRYMGHTGTLMQTVIEAETEFAEHVVRTAYPLVQKAAEIYFVVSRILPADEQWEGMKELIDQTLPMLEVKYNSSNL